MTRAELEALVAALEKFEATAPTPLKVSWSDSLDDAKRLIRDRLAVSA